MLTISERLARCGQELLGHGDAALVWGHPDEPFVIKAGWDGTDGWPAWAMWCMANRGSHVPIVHACHVIEHDGRRVGFVGVVERLQPAAAPAIWFASDRLLKRNPVRLAALIEAEHPSVADLLLTAAAAFPSARWDMAPSNWMARRDGTLVLTDPLSRA